MVKYRANVHTFGNTGSPAVATFGLRFTTRQDIAQNKPEASRFILHNFYVDDGMASTDEPAEAIKILKDAREILGKHHIRLHKLVSSSQEVVEAFPSF